MKPLKIALSAVTMALLLSACADDERRVQGDGMGGVGNEVITDPDDTAGGGSPSPDIDAGNGSGPGAGSGNPPSGHVPTTSGVSPDIVRFLVMGDSGSGSDGQMATGAAMADVCEAKGRETAVRALSREQAIRQGCQFVLGLGDNIYESGTTTARDPQFFDKFEKAYLTFPAELPFYMVSGNHDNTALFGGDGAGNARGETQVQYTYQSVDGTGSDAANPRKTPRWRMPARYYDVSAGGTRSEPLVHLFAIDSNQIAGGFPDASADYRYSTYGLRQLDWLKRGLRESRARFKIAFAHHPYLSNGDHGNAGNYDDLIAAEAGVATASPAAPSLQAALLPVLAGQRYKDFLEEAMCDVTDLYVNGHDHDLQWLTAVPSCGRTEFVVSGAAGKMRSVGDAQRNLARLQRYDRYGFFWMEVRLDRVSNRPELVSELYTVTPGSDGASASDAATRSGSVTLKRIDGSVERTLAYRYRRESEPAPVAGTALHDYLSRFGEQNTLFRLRQRPQAGLPPSSAFSAQSPFNQCNGAAPVTAALRRESAVTPAAGPLDPLQAVLQPGLQAAISAQPTAEGQQLLSVLADASLAGLDMADVLLQAAIDSASSPDQAAALQQAAARDVLRRMSALGSSLQAGLPASSSLPEPLRSLPQMVSRYQGEVAAAEADSACPSGDLGAVVAPLVRLSRNLANVAEGAERASAEVPVLGGATRLLAGVLGNVSSLVVATGSTRTSAINDTLLGTADRLLRDVALDVVPLRTFAPAPVVDGVTAVPVALSGAVLLVSREITYRLDQLLQPALSPLAALVDTLLATLGVRLDD
ncbi:metallophosphoesterase [Perlucidibaca piscinae]|uniref:metallophosphoesterase n=1 Tax=Perlucidibaca piscinae TaxID=392589 RepID=UPI0003B78416|nr:metallophosphoesterase [Perlucidibaca piscinae]